MDTLKRIVGADLTEADLNRHVIHYPTGEIGRLLSFTQDTLTLRFRPGLGMFSGPAQQCGFWIQNLVDADMLGVLAPVPAYSAEERTELVGLATLCGGEG
jgi:hypothetical protein